MIFVYDPTFLIFLVRSEDSTNRDNAYKATTGNNATIDHTDLEEFKCKPFQSA